MLFISDMAIKMNTELPLCTTLFMLKYGIFYPLKQLLIAQFLSSFSDFDDISLLL